MTAETKHQSVWDTKLFWPAPQVPKNQKISLKRGWSIPIGNISTRGSTHVGQNSWIISWNRIIHKCDGSIMRFDKDQIPDQITVKTKKIHRVTLTIYWIWNYFQQPATVGWQDNWRHGHVASQRKTLASCNRISCTKWERGIHDWDSNQIQEVHNRNQLSRRLHQTRCEMSSRKTRHVNGDQNYQTLEVNKENTAIHFQNTQPWN